MKKLLIGTFLGVALAMLGVIAIGLSGRINLAATEIDPPPLAWFLHTAYEHSVARHAADIVIAADLDAATRIERGARSFAEMCAGCHTPPGLSDTPRTTGLNPKPPELIELSGQYTLVPQIYRISPALLRITGGKREPIQLN